MKTKEKMGRRLAIYPTYISSRKEGAAWTEQVEAFCAWQERGRADTDHKARASGCWAGKLAGAESGSMGAWF